MAGRLDSLPEHLRRAALEEQRRGLRALLRAPLLSAVGEFEIEHGFIRRHSEELRKWLQTNTGWRLHVDAELARLRKTPVNLDDATRGAKSEDNLPFSRRRYVILCLALAVLERSERQTTLGRLFEGIVEHMEAEPEFDRAGIALDMKKRRHRKDLVVAVQRLMASHVLLRIDGDEHQFVSQEKDVLYTIDRNALSLMLNVRRGPSTVDSATVKDLESRMAAILEESLPDTDADRRRRLRYRLTRRLLDDPVLYLADLDLEEQEYFKNQYKAIAERISKATGMIAEIRAEGIAMVDEYHTMSDMHMPEEGTDGHVTLLLADYLANRLRQNGSVVVGITELENHVLELTNRYRKYWRKNVTDPKAEVDLTRMALRRLESLRLVRREENGIQPLAAIARFSVGVPDEAVNNE